ncbi:MAG: hypothetical protein LH702_01135 [Phormidesmis sp. CAN_BIN44]|nr:hypothetical protein [Phormidesmis sp. CAN_BIN44]
MHPIVQLCGDAAVSHGAIAASACQSLDRPLYLTKVNWIAFKVKFD